MSFYVSLDSWVGNLCFFAVANSGVPGCTVATTQASGPGIPAAVIKFINSGLTVNAAATEIRPEGAKFANIRALAFCGQPVGRFLGLATRARTPGKRDPVSHKALLDSDWH